MIFDNVIIERAVATASTGVNAAAATTNKTRRKLQACRARKRTAHAWRCSFPAQQTATAYRWPQPRYAGRNTASRYRISLCPPRPVHADDAPMRIIIATGSGYQTAAASRRYDDSLYSDDPRNSRSSRRRPRSVCVGQTPGCAQLGTHKRKLNAYGPGRLQRSPG